MAPPGRLRRHIYRRRCPCCQQSCSATDDTNASKSTSILSHVGATHRLRSFLQKHGAFPECHRARAWRILLALPRDDAAFSSLCDASTEELPPWMQASTPKKCWGLDNGRLLEQTLRKLKGWCPALLELASLPTVVAPFIHVFGDDHVLLFEICAFFFLNWGESWIIGPWLQGVLEKPRSLLEHAWNALAVVDHELLAHLSSTLPGDARCSIIWPLLQSVFSDCLPRPAWLVLWDHLVLLWREPEMIAVAAVAILRCLRETLLTCQGDMVCDTLKRVQVVAIPRLLEELYSLRERTSKLESGLPKRSLQRLLVNDGAYTPLLREPHAVLDYLVQDRSRSRAEIEGFRSACRQAELKYSALDRLVTEESKAVEERQIQLSAEEARRASSLLEDAKLEEERRSHADAVLSMRMNRLDRASASVMVSLEQEHALHNAERARLADEKARQQRRMVMDNETLAREAELASLESWAVQQLSQVTRHHRVEQATRELRQKARAEMLKRDREDEAARLSQKAEDERERACMRMDVERQLEAHQWHLADIRQREIEGQLDLDDHMRRVQLGQVAHERSVRSAAHEARASSEVRMLSLRRKLAEEQRAQAEKQGSHVANERQRQDLRLQKQWLEADAERKRTRKSLERQAERLHNLALMEEQNDFELRLARALAATEANITDNETALRQELEVIEEIRGRGERADALDTRRRDLLAHRGTLRRRARSVASEILGQDRERFSAGIEAWLPQVGAGDETSETSSEDGNSARQVGLSRLEQTNSSSSPPHYVNPGTSVR